MRARLTAATIASLIEKGYARTTAVEVCARAGVTRGAFHHHFASLSALYAVALETLYRDLLAAAPPPSPSGDPHLPLQRLVRRIAAYTQRPEFKAVIEIWLAARNDAALRVEVGPAMQQLSTLFDPAQPEIARRIGRSKRAAAFYRLVMEATIGMALGRAVSPANRPVAHEAMVIDLLSELAAEL
ncbi:MAG: TetR/AcrR family transcriptional regulator [Deltaproteobacteria bacterium]|nr:TetR/AcrR family transcriptional regulator [Deltaproteobacteria bacterium]